mmetsp:Transcript_25450/g.71172  ORF Transcript_25450/g.71172 Transcript_25450/m.71172 type:complete len:285 (-) Transcript_25450:326-1180(-)|eukprot:CAMPEP_0117673086 /NCGR_PEP_ID=MMETSP0804-20121206/14279_1 /TAXON_ID=1074897 /ORGANISM="Tetraselmis astigmatica, Strain CCMP880" /LENGTH=284 /DNA_ID=CAMNT_0005481789 /DNA_START=119 /DNA_END=973 /DNA_ORIENTATION=-
MASETVGPIPGAAEVPALLQWEANFDGWDLIYWIQENWMLPFVSCAIYVVMVFFGPPLLKGAGIKPMKGKAILAVWNLSLSAFSWIGVSRCVPHLAAAVQAHGFKYTLCTHPQEWYMKGGVALWMGLFCISKLPELLDTLFLVLRQKPVIFLHWYHHVSVLLYCWHAYHFTIPPGIWFACMNFTVHGIMYFYYFLMAVGMYKLASNFSGFVTAMQITQMLIGTVVMGMAGYYFLTEGEDKCYNNKDNVFLGIGMYISYFLLFAAFAVKRYLLPSKNPFKAKKTQ